MIGVFMEELVYDACEVTSPIQQKITILRAERDIKQKAPSVGIPIYEGTANVSNSRG